MTSSSQQDRGFQSAPGSIGANGNGHGGGFQPELIAVPAEQPPANAIDLKTVWNAFRRRWFLATSLGLLLGAGAAVAAWYVIPPAPYTASAEIRVRPFDPAWKFPTEIQQANAGAFKETQKRLIKFPLTLDAALDRPEISALPTVKQQPVPREWLESELDVDDSGAEFIRVSLSGDRPEDLPLIVNAVVDVYIRDVTLEHEEVLEDRLAELEKFRKRISDDLEDKRRQRQAAAQEGLRASTPEALTYLQQADSEIYAERVSQYVEVESRLKLAKIKLDVLTASDSDSTAEVSPTLLTEAVDQEPEVLEAEDRVENQRKHVTWLENSSLSPNHRDIQKARRLLAEAEEELEAVRERVRDPVRERLTKAIEQNAQRAREELKREVDWLTQLSEQLKQAVSEQERRQSEGVGQQMALSARLADEATDAELLLGFDREIARLRIEIEQQESREKEERYSRRTELQRISLFRPAVVPRKPDIGRKVKMTGLAGFGTFGLIVAGIVLLEWRTRRISSLDEVASGLHLRVVGTVPNLPSSIRNGKARRNGRSAFWHSVLAESIDSTRTVLLRDANRATVQAVMVSSATTGEGKTTLACHLATSLARAGRKVLLVDCDLRRPSIHRVFDLPARSGVCEILRGQAALEEAVQATVREGLFVLPAGRIDSQALTALAQDGIADLIEAARARFDFMILDSAPLLSVTDTVLIAQHVDGVLLAVRHDVSRKLKIAAACERMAMLNIPVLGAVAIGLHDAVYGYRYRYGQDARYLGAEEHPAASGANGNGAAPSEE